MRFNKRIIKAISKKTKETEGGLKETTSIKISVPKEGEGYEDIWPMVTTSTKNSDLIEKGATLNVYLSEDKRFVNAVYKWEPKEDSSGPSDENYTGVNAGADADGDNIPF